jgi:hypothetical protein
MLRQGLVFSLGLLTYGLPLVLLLRNSYFASNPGQHALLVLLGGLPPLLMSAWALRSAMKSRSDQSAAK